MCRPCGAADDRTMRPTVETVGYLVTSLRDFQQQKAGRTTFTAIEIFRVTGSYRSAFLGDSCAAFSSRSEMSFFIFAASGACGRICRYLL